MGYQGGWVRLGFGVRLDHRSPRIPETWIIIFTMHFFLNRCFLVTSSVSRFTTCGRVETNSRTERRVLVDGSGTGGLDSDSEEVSWDSGGESGPYQSDSSLENLGEVPHDVAHRFFVPLPPVRVGTPPCLPQTPPRNPDRSSVFEASTPRRPSNLGWVPGGSNHLLRTWDRSPREKSSSTLKTDRL